MADGASELLRRKKKLSPGDKGDREREKRRQWRGTERRAFIITSGVGRTGFPRVQMLFSGVKGTLLDAHSSVPAL